MHGKPEEKKLNVLLETLNALGVAAELPEDVSPRDFRAITDRLGHDEQRPFIESLIVRSMMQAVYQPQNIGHFGLALEHYAHFTSPIRRYPDLVVHRTPARACCRTPIHTACATTAASSRSPAPSSRSSRSAPTSRIAT